MSHAAQYAEWRSLSELVEPNEKELMVQMTTQHPYQDYEDSVLWLIIEKALDALVENQDVILCTRKEYIIGYLVKSLSIADVTDSKASEE